jgi:hypothetical protein
MHTALVSRLLRDRTLWEETSDVLDTAEEGQPAGLTRLTPQEA